MDKSFKKRGWTDMARQIDILMRANDYLRKLNKGYDPLSGARLPDFSAAWESEVSMGFFICMRELEKIINYDSAETRPAFSMTPEQAAKLRPAGGSVSVLELVRRINRRINMIQCRGLNVAILTAWLGREGYFAKNGNGRMVPTARGKELGISCGGERGFTFDRNAQQFVIDHIQELAGFAGEQSTDSSHHKTRPDPGNTKSRAAAMRRLSEGLHPSSGAPLDERDPLTQEKLKKCFEYTALALEHVLKVGYYTARETFTLPRELWKEIEISQEPVSIAGFAKAVNALLPDPMAVDCLSGRTVRDYLISKGLLQSVKNEAGKMQMVPTAGGNAVGIELGDAKNKDGSPYSAVLYTADAQRYLAEHLGEIIEFAAAKG